MALDIFGIILISLLSSARLAQVVNGQWWAVPLLIHSLLAVILLIMHGKPSSESPFFTRVIAWISAFLPLAIRVEVEAPILIRVISIAGVAFSLWGLASLGKAFDIAPADRGLVVNGPYRFMRHPIYAGQLFSVAVMTLADFTLWNWLILIILVFTLIMRIVWEEKIICGYAAYAKTVRKRLVPGIW